MRVQKTVKLEHATMAYSSEEDRIRLDGIDCAGRTIRLWFTARLLSRLVTYLQSKINHSSFFSAQSRDAASKDPYEVGGTWPEVNIDAGALEVLVTSIDVTVESNHVALRYRGLDGEEKAETVLTYQLLGQWVRGVRRCFENAGWPLELFLDERNGPQIVGISGAITVH